MQSARQSNATEGKAAEVSHPKTYHMQSPQDVPHADPATGAFGEANTKKGLRNPQESLRNPEGILRIP